MEFKMLENSGEEKINVLVIEDDRDDMEKLATALERSSCFAVHRLYSYQGIDLAEEIKRYKADVISLDLEMEGEIHAQPLVRALKRIDPTLGIGAVTWHITFAHYLEDVDFFFAKNWSELDECAMTFKMSGLRRILSWLMNRFNELMELGIGPSSLGISTYTELPSFASKLALLIKSEDWPFELRRYTEFINEVHQFPKKSGDIDFRDWLGSLYNAAAELRQQVTRVGIHYDLLEKSLEEEKFFEAPSEVELEERRVRRYTDILFPEECELEQEVTLSVQLRVEGETEVIEVLFSGEEEVEILVLISGKAFEIPQRAKIMVVPYDGDSQKVEFALIPRRLGEQAISIEFFKGAARIGYIIATTFVKERK